MAVQDYSTTPGNNTSISGINIAENCPAGNINGALRQMMADIRVFYNGVPVAADYLKKDGTVATTGQLTYSGRGAYMHWNSSAQTSGRVFIQAAGGAAPAMNDGDWLLEY